MKHSLVKIGLIACAFALAVASLAGCASGASNLTSEQQAARSYMSQVNGIMDELGDNLDSFVDAVSRGDVVNMRTQADNAYKALDELAALEVPDDLTDVAQGYADGTAKLRSALDNYITLYTEINAGSFDQSTYDDRLAAIQSEYDEGVSLLQKADETAAEK